MRQSNVTVLLMIRMHWPEGVRSRQHVALNLALNGVSPCYRLCMHFIVRMGTSRIFHLDAVLIEGVVSGGGCVCECEETSLFSISRCTLLACPAQTLCKSITASLTLSIGVKQLGYLPQSQLTRPLYPTPFDGTNLWRMLCLWIEQNLTSFTLVLLSTVLIEAPNMLVAATVGNKE